MELPKGLFIPFLLVFIKFSLVLTSAVNTSTPHHVPVSNSEELREALANSVPGDMVILSDGTYEGPFTAITNGTHDKPIFVVASKLGARNLTIFGVKEEPAFIVHGNHWRLIHLNFDGFVGLHVTGNDFWGNDLVVKNGDNGIVLEGHQNIVMHSYVADVIKVGILVKGNRAILARNAIIRTGTSIQVEKSACCGYIKDNVCDGPVLINGKKVVHKNTMHLH